MGIGIGLHCWYCEHGPCNGTCERQDKKKLTKEEIWKLIEKMPEKDKIYIEEKLDELRIKESRKNFEELRRKSK